MKCPSCGDGRAIVRCLETRQVGDTRRRRYVCTCSARFSTLETIALPTPGGKLQLADEVALQKQLARRITRDLYEVLEKYLESEGG